MAAKFLLLQTIRSLVYKQLINAACKSIRWVSYTEAWKKVSILETARLTWGKGGEGARKKLLVRSVPDGHGEIPVSPNNYQRNRNPSLT